MISLPELAREATASFNSADNQAALVQTSNLTSYLGLVASLGIFFMAGQSGAAVCDTDLSSWHAVNATVALVSILHASWQQRAANGADIDLTPTAVKHARFAVALSGFSFVWWIVLQMRLWGTHACVMHEQESCCDPTLYKASFWYLVATYIGLGIGCCCTFAMLSFFAGAMSAAIAAEAVNAEQDSGSASERAGPTTTTTRGSNIPDLQVRLLGKGEQV